MRSNLATAIAFILTANVALASDIDELKKAGLEGKWATDCAKPSSATNIHATWTPTADGHVILTTDTDKKDESPSTLVLVKTLPENRVLYTVKVEDGEIDVVLKFDKNRYRMWSSSMATATAGSADEEFYVKDGKILANGQDSEWYQKCAK